jgi:hypothetical protein
MNQHGRIGEWIITLGFVSEHQVLAALAHQWACPILSLRQPIDQDAWKILPGALALQFSVVPVHFGAATRTLTLAMAGPVDHLLLYQLQDQRSAISGVSLDEEAANMIRYQGAYDAAARVISAINDMTNTVIQLGKY